MIEAMVKYVYASKKDNTAHVIISAEISPPAHVDIGEEVYFQDCNVGRIATVIQKENNLSKNITTIIVDDNLPIPIPRLPMVGDTVVLCPSSS